MKMDSLIRYATSNFRKYTGLTSLILVFALYDQLLDGFLKQFIESIALRMIILLALLIGMFVIWLVYRRYLPKGKKDRIVIVISIVTENRKQHVRLTNDFSREIQKLSVGPGFSGKFQIVTMDNHQAKRVNEVLSNYSEYYNASKHSKDNVTKQAFMSSKKKLNKLSLRLHAQLFVWGTAKERMEKEPSYFLELKPTVNHYPISYSSSLQLEKDMSSTFPSMIQISAKHEFSGFKMAGEHVQKSARFIIGMAANLSHCPDIAIAIHSPLKQELDSIENLKPPLTNMKKILKFMLSDSHCLNSAKAYLSANHSLAEQEIEKSIRLNRSNYSAHIIKAMILFRLRRDVDNALQEIKRAEKIAKQTKRSINDEDCSWLYSRAFLLAYIGSLEKAFKDLQRLKDLGFSGEEFVEIGCDKFYREIITEEPDKPQLIFMAAYLTYYKRANLPIALELIDEYLAQVSNNEECEFFTVRAKGLKQKLETELGESADR